MGLSLENEDLRYTPPNAEDCRSEGHAHETTASPPGPLANDLAHHTIEKQECDVPNQSAKTIPDLSSEALGLLQPSKSKYQKLGRLPFLTARVLLRLPK
jgi:hypothetical protein